MEERVVVVGAGTMGTGIALVAARAGYRVELVEPDASACARALETLRHELEADPQTLARIACVERIGDGSQAGIAIEAVSERFEVKREVFDALARALGPDALLATNTSSLSVAALADTVPHAERVVGLHFFNPPSRMELVEVVAAPQASDVALDRAEAFVARIGKRAVLASDTPGFIVNRVARPYYLQAMRALERGIASIEELDALARGVGFRMGPFALMDFIGLDVNLATSESIYARTEAERLAPVEIQRAMVAEGRLGRKSGAGFYDYRNGVPQRFEPVVETSSGAPNADERVAVIGYGGIADEIAELLEHRYAHIARIADDELLDELSLETTIVVHVGDGATDRSDAIIRIDEALAPEAILFADAYAIDVRACARRMAHPERLVGYGVLGSLTAQRNVEIVDSDAVSDDALELAQEVFGELGKGTVLVGDHPGLFLGRTVGSIVNEAAIAVAQDVASPEDVDTAMQLGANYPLGPIVWGREIGGARLTRILRRLADAEGEAFAPHRSLWVLDVEDAPEQEMTLQ